MMRLETNQACIVSSSMLHSTQNFLCCAETEGACEWVSRPAVDGAVAPVWGFARPLALLGRACKVASSECFDTHKHRLTANQRALRLVAQLLAG